MAESKSNINLKKNVDDQSDSKSTVENKRIGDRIIAGYSRFVVRFPWIVIIIVVVVVSVFGGIAFKFSDLPDFSEPTKGFEARGTYIKGSRLAYGHMQNNLLPSATTGKRKRSTGAHSKLAVLTHNTEMHHRSRRSVGNGFCHFYSSGGFLKFTFEGADRDHKNLFTKDSLQGMCRFEEEVLKKSSNYVNGENCLGISLGNLVGLLAGNKTCMQVDDADVQLVFNKLKTCAQSYYSGTLDTDPQCNVRMETIYFTSHNAIYMIFHYLTDANFLPKDQTGNDILQYSMILHSDNGDTLNFYQTTIDNHAFEDNHVKLVAVGADIKFDLFTDYMLGDVVLFAIAFILILLSMVLYLSSFMVTIATIFDIIFSFVTAYFLYHIVFRFTFFPFMNVLTALILIAVGADDVFVFMDIWLQEAKKNPDQDLVFRLEKTLRHASLSVFVTSATTASAFLANMVSTITSVKCFGMFSALAIISNFFLMITWVPAVVVLLEKLYLRCCKNMTCCACYEKLEVFCHKISTTVFEKFFPYIISKFWFGWIALWAILGIGGLVVIFGVPTLKLPTSSDFQFFPSSHYLEVYDLKIKNNFRFVTEQVSSNLYVQYIFGVKNVDNGNHYDPNSEGSLDLDTKFNYGTEYLTFLLNFCNDILNAPFISNQTKIFLECNINYLMNNGLVVAYYNKTDVKAISMTFESTYKWTASHLNMSNFRDAITNFIEDRVPTAPEGLKSGFVHSELDFYDLQSELSSGTYLSIAVSLICASVVMFLTTFNVLITLFAIVTITLAISITIGLLVLLGWELNILESVSISLAVGMSIDFTIHYGVAYKLSKCLSRKDRTNEAFSTVGSAVAMAAFTTFIAGACVISSRVLSYAQLGTFLMIVMAFSWACATLFFQSLCYKFGPEENCAQVPCCCGKQKATDSSNTMDIKSNGSMGKNNSVGSESVNVLSDKKQVEGVSNPAMEYDKDSKTDLEKCDKDHTIKENDIDDNQSICVHL